VTCSETSMAHGNHTHCGGCFQCVDRRFSISATQLTDYDQASLYTLDFLSEPISDPESKTALIDYVRLGLKFANQSADAFYDEHLSEISETIGPGDNPDEIVLELSNLAKRFGQQTIDALRQYHRHADITRPTVTDSLLDIIDKREYLKLEPERLAERICERLNAAIPIMFARQKPKDENDFNDKVHGLLKSESEEYRREFPVSSFALAKVIPDHEYPNHNVLIESKYLRGSTTASKITDALAADLVKYPSSSFVVFALYDPERSIRDDAIFTRDIENIRHCRVLIMR
jgi:REase_DpnII-MboI